MKVNYENAVIAAFEKKSLGNVNKLGFSMGNENAVVATFEKKSLENINKGGFNMGSIGLEPITTPV